jgi:hypothetical protein
MSCLYLALESALCAVQQLEALEASDSRDVVALRPLQQRVEDTGRSTPQSRPQRR